MKTATLALFLLTTPVWAMDKTVSVSGECSRYVTSDRGNITMTVEHTDKNVKVANTKTSDVYNELKKNLEKLNLKDFEIETTEYNVFEHKEWENNKAVSKGYKSRMGLKISTSEISKLGDVMVTANNLGVTEVGGLQTYVSETKMKSLEIDCLKVASLDAKAKAEALANTLGAKIEGVLTISDASVSYNPIPQPLYMAKGMRASGTMESMAVAEVAPGKEKYSLRVQTTFKLE